MAVTLSEFQKAVRRLQEALDQEKNEFIRDSVIQRFEFCVELAWKTSKKSLGLSAMAPKVVIREMAQAGVIDDPNRWFDYLEARNLSSHSYNEDVAEKIYNIAKLSIGDFEKLCQKLQTV